MGRADMVTLESAIRNGWAIPEETLRQQTKHLWELVQLLVPQNVIAGGSSSIGRELANHVIAELGDIDVAG